MRHPQRVFSVLVGLGVAAAACSRAEETLAPDPVSEAALDERRPDAHQDDDAPPVSDGISCWDLDGDGVNDPAEEKSGDGVWDASDCRGAQGAAGVSCWDENADAKCNPGEDQNGDRKCDAYDCRAPAKAEPSLSCMTVRGDPVTVAAGTVEPQSAIAVCPGGHTVVGGGWLNAPETPDARPPVFESKSTHGDEWTVVVNNPSTSKSFTFRAQARCCVLR